MALNRHVLTSTVTVPAGTVITTLTAGEPATGGAGGYGNAATSTGYGLWPHTFPEGTTIGLDSAVALYATTGAGNARVRGRPGRPRRGGPVKLTQGDERLFIVMAISAAPPGTTARSRTGEASPARRPPPR